MIQWSLPDPERDAVEVSSERSGPDALITLSSTGDGGDYVDLSGAAITITGPSGVPSAPLTPYQSAPGEWQLRVANPEAGAYEIAIESGDGSASVGSLSTFSIPPSPELRPDPAAADLMEQLAGRTGGRLLSLDDPGALFDAPAMGGNGIANYRAVWWLPLSLALALVLIELAYRYRALDRLRHLVSA